ncbi:MAG: TraR/DksA C4-type zinc finger protein [Candidatus Pacebacteria bacterium]|nr:TraR/DksA C4-type zinc finger protein [Candidatus Paceibacterota bacterium]MBP9852058.1 TraR/DksA C4-type zinc finger protein [Candidatus Paceibacterota bacterium]
MKNDALRTKLEEEKALLIEELKEIGMIVDAKTGTWEAVPEKQLPTSDENDLADKFESYEERSDMLLTLKTRYNEIVSALEKMDTKGFGICEVCGAPVEADRMAANPAAKTCKAHMNTQ